MGYKPTLGGLKQAQKFLAMHGFSLPVFQMDIYSDGFKLNNREWPGKGKTISIDEAIEKYGATREVVDVRLADKEEGGDVFVSFSKLDHYGNNERENVANRGYDVVIEVSVNGPTFSSRLEDFLKSSRFQTFVNIAKWGMANPTLGDKMLFRLRPKRYAERVFGQK